MCQISELFVVVFLFSLQFLKTEIEVELCDIEALADADVKTQEQGFSCTILGVLECPIVHIAFLKVRLFLLPPPVLWLDQFDIVENRNQWTYLAHFSKF